MNCSEQKILGRTAALAYYIGDPCVRPDAGLYTVLGSITAKGLSPSYDTVDSTTDSTVGNIKATDTTYLNFEISADGLLDAASHKADLQALFDHFLSQGTELTKNQPRVWFTFAIPDFERVQTCNMNITEFSIDAPTPENITFSMAASASGTSQLFNEIYTP